MSETLVIATAHQDDWPLFMGAAVFEHLRRPNARVVLIVTTAGDAGTEPWHWQSRFSGALLALVRALPDWSPYDPQARGFSVSYEQVTLADKVVLRARVVRDDRECACMYLMHLPDGSARGTGFPPAFASLERLRAGQRLTALWPPEHPSVYESWDAFTAVLREILAHERDGEPVRIFAADPDPERNPGDHSDHRHTSLAIEELARGDASLRPIWFKTYCIAALEENLDASASNDQRAAIFAYGGGYMAAAAGETQTWRTGWEREYPRLRSRQYPCDPNG
jgi:hypothetical protein